MNEFNESMDFQKSTGSKNLHSYTGKKVSAYAAFAACTIYERFIMYYKDLSCYRDGEDDDIDVFPSVKNVGWLDKEYKYEEGSVSTEIVNKLKEIIFLDAKNNEDKQNGNYKSETAVNVHCMHIRGRAYKCSLCDEEKEILYEPSNLEYYQGSTHMKAGLNEVCIPSLKHGEFYTFPTTG